jgi:hypothetical protein
MEVVKAIEVSEAGKITIEFLRVNQVLKFNNSISNIALFWWLKKELSVESWHIRLNFGTLFVWGYRG